MAILHSWLNQGLGGFLPEGLVLGIDWVAALIRVVENSRIGSAAWRMVCLLTNDMHRELNSDQSALLSAQWVGVGVVDWGIGCKEMGKWSLPCGSWRADQVKSWKMEGEQIDRSMLVRVADAGWQ